MSDSATKKRKRTESSQETFFDFVVPTDLGAFAAAAEITVLETVAGRTRSAITKFARTTPSTSNSKPATKTKRTKRASTVVPSLQNLKSADTHSETPELRTVANCSDPDFQLSSQQYSLSSKSEQLQSFCIAEQPPDRNPYRSRPEHTLNALLIGQKRCEGLSDGVVHDHMSGVSEHSKHAWNDTLSRIGENQTRSSWERSRVGVAEESLSSLEIEVEADLADIFEGLSSGRALCPMDWSRLGQLAMVNSFGPQTPQFKQRRRRCYGEKSGDVSPLIIFSPVSNMSSSKTLCIPPQSHDFPNKPFYESQSNLVHVDATVAVHFQRHIDHIVWDPSGERVVTVDVTGRIAVWQMRENLVNQWEPQELIDLDERVVKLRWFESQTEYKAMPAPKTKLRPRKFLPRPDSPRPPKTSDSTSTNGHVIDLTSDGGDMESQDAAGRNSLDTVVDLTDNGDEDVAKQSLGSSSITSSGKTYYHEAAAKDFDNDTDEDNARIDIDFPKRRRFAYVGKGAVGPTHPFGWTGFVLVTESAKVAICVMESIESNVTYAWEHLPYPASDLMSMDIEHSHSNNSDELTCGPIRITHADIAFTGENEIRIAMFAERSEGDGSTFCASGEERRNEMTVDSRGSATNDPSTDAAQLRDRCFGVVSARCFLDVDDLDIKVIPESVCSIPLYSSHLPSNDSTTSAESNARAFVSDHHNNKQSDEHLHVALRQFLSTYGNQGSSVLHVNWVNDTSNRLIIVLGCTKSPPSSSRNPKVDRCSAILLWEQEGLSYRDQSWRLTSTRFVEGGFPTSVRVVQPTLDFPARNQSDFANAFDDVLDGQYFPSQVGVFGLSDGTVRCLTIPSLEPTWFGAHHTVDHARFADESASRRMSMDAESAVSTFTSADGVRDDGEPIRGRKRGRPPKVRRRSRGGKGRRSSRGSIQIDTDINSQHSATIQSASSADTTDEKTPTSINWDHRGSRTLSQWIDCCSSNHGPSDDITLSLVTSIAISPSSASFMCARLEIGQGDPAASVFLDSGFANLEQPRRPPVILSSVQANGFRNDDLEAESSSVPSSESIPQNGNRAPHTSSDVDDIAETLSRLFVLGLANGVDFSDLVDITSAEVRCGVSHSIIQDVQLWDCLPDRILERVNADFNLIMPNPCVHVPGPYDESNPKRTAKGSQIVPSAEVYATAVGTGGAAMRFPFLPHSSASAEGALAGLQMAMLRMFAGKVVQYENTFTMIQLHGISEMMMDAFVNPWATEEVTDLARRQWDFETHPPEQGQHQIRRESLLDFASLGVWVTDLCISLLRSMYVCFNLRITSHADADAALVTQSVPTVSQADVSPDAQDKEIVEQLTSRPSPIALLFHTATRRNLIQILLLMHFARTSIREYQHADNSRLEYLQASLARGGDELTVRKHMAVIKEDLNRLRSVEHTLNRSRLQFELFGRILVDLDGHVSKGESGEEEEETTGDCDWWWESPTREGSVEAGIESGREPLESTRQLVHSVRGRVKDEVRIFIQGTLPHGYERAVGFLRRKMESSLTQLFTEPSADAGAGSGAKELSALAMLGNLDTEWLELRRMQEVPAANTHILRTGVGRAHLEYLRALHADSSTNDFGNPTTQHLHAQYTEERNRFFERVSGIRSEVVDEATLIRSHHDVITKRNLNHQNAIRQCTKCFHMSALRIRQPHTPSTTGGAHLSDATLRSPSNGVTSPTWRRHSTSRIEEVMSRREIITSERRKKVRDHMDEVVAATSTFDDDVDDDVFDWERSGVNGTMGKAGTFQREKVSWHDRACRCGGRWRLVLDLPGMK
ncbi:hypothetical protein BJ742DRAFT_790742 [Cladochytrium replicatum]|nr:hypothetical protein BJ742DRAFT_790742 [Cladochytrium replicatum]